MTTFQTWLYQTLTNYFFYIHLTCYHKILLVLLPVAPQRFITFENENGKTHGNNGNNLNWKYQPSAMDARVLACRDVRNTFRQEYCHLYMSELGRESINFGVKPFIQIQFVVHMK